MNHSTRRLALLLLGAAGSASGVFALERRSRRRRGRFRVFVLTYHDVAARGPEGEGILSAARFERQLRFLARRYRLVAVGRAIEQLRRGELAEDLVAISFDDGYAGNSEAAWPVLRRLGLPACFFLSTGFLDGEPLWFDVVRRGLDALGSGALRPPELERLGSRLGLGVGRPGRGDWLAALKRGSDADRRRVAAVLLTAASARLGARAMTWEQARSMAKEGAELGCHTVDHPILARLPRAEQDDQIARARGRIESAAGVSVTLLAYPNGRLGDYNRDSIEIAREQGFAAAFTTRRGANEVGDDPFELRRIGVGADPWPMLAARLAATAVRLERPRRLEWPG